MLASSALPGQTALARSSHVRQRWQNSVYLRTELLHTPADLGGCGFQKGCPRVVLKGTQCPDCVGQLLACVLVQHPCCLL